MKSFLSNSIYRKISLLLLSAIMIISVSLGIGTLSFDTAKAATAGPNNVSISLADASVANSTVFSHQGNVIETDENGVATGATLTDGWFSDWGYVTAKTTINGYTSYNNAIDIITFGDKTANYDDFVLDMNFGNFVIFDQYSEFNIFFHVPSYDNLNYDFGGVGVKFTKTVEKIPKIVVGRQYQGVFTEYDSVSRENLFPFDVYDDAGNTISTAVFSLRIVVKGNQLAVLIDGNQVFYTDKLTDAQVGHFEIYAYDAGASIGFPITFADYTTVGSAVSGAYMFGGQPLTDNVSNNDSDTAVYRAGNYDGEYYYVGGVKNYDYTSYSVNSYDSVIVKDGVKDFDTTLNLRLSLVNVWSTFSIAFRSTVSNVDTLTGYALLFKLTGDSGSANTKITVSVKKMQNQWMGLSDDLQPVGNAQASLDESLINNKQTKIRLVVKDSSIAVFVDGERVILSNALTEFNAAGKIIYNSNNAGVAITANPLIKAPLLETFAEGMSVTYEQAKAGTEFTAGQGTFNDAYGAYFVYGFDGTNYNSQYDDVVIGVDDPNSYYADFVYDGTIYFKKRSDNSEAIVRLFFHVYDNIAWLANYVEFKVGTDGLETVSICRHNGNGGAIVPENVTTYGSVSGKNLFDGLSAPIKLACLDNSVSIFVNGALVLNATITDSALTGHMELTTYGYGIALGFPQSIKAYATETDLTKADIKSAPHVIGKSVRIIEPSGLRFLYKAVDYDYLKNLYGDSNVSFGALLIPTSMIVGDLTVDTVNAKIIDSRNSGFLWYDTQQRYFSITVVNIPSMEYNTKVSSRAFVRIIVDGQVKYYYSKILESTVAEVAAVALNDVKDTPTGLYQYPVEVSGVTKYSPYDEAKRAVLTNYIT